MFLFSLQTFQNNLELVTWPSIVLILVRKHSEPYLPNIIRDWHRIKTYLDACILVEYDKRNWVYQLRKKVVYFGIKGTFLKRKLPATQDYCLRPASGPRVEIWTNGVEWNCNRTHNFKYFCSCLCFTIPTTGKRVGKRKECLSKL